MLIGIVLAVSVLFWTGVCFLIGYTIGMGAILKRVPPEVRTRLEAGLRWRNGRA